MSLHNHVIQKLVRMKCSTIFQSHNIKLYFIQYITLKKKKILKKSRSKTRKDLNSKNLKLTFFKIIDHTLKPRNLIFIYVLSGSKT